MFNVFLVIVNSWNGISREFTGGRKYQREKEKSGKTQVFISFYTENGCTDFDYRVSVDICKYKERISSDTCRYEYKISFVLVILAIGGVRFILWKKRKETR